MENASKVKKPTGARYSDEVRERAVRMVLENQHEYETQCAAMRSIAAKMGMSRETLRNWVIKLSVIAGSGLAQRRRIWLGSKSLSVSVRFGNCAQPTRSCARRPRISRRRSSTADRSHDHVYRRSSCALRGRVDLPVVADRPVDILSAYGSPARPAAMVDTSSPRRGIEGPD